MTITPKTRRTGAALLGLIIAVVLLFVWEDEKPPRQYFVNQGKVFGTFYTIRYENTVNLQDSIDASLKAFDNCLSLFNPHSLLSAVNANRDTVTDACFEAMWSEAERVYILSDGAFDITVAPLVNYWGFGNRKKNHHSESCNLQPSINSLREFVGFDKVALVNHRVVKSDPRVQLDCGAVAKGQACDVIAAMLERNGCSNYLVEIGGEVVCRGQNAQGDKWHIGITKPNRTNDGADNELQEILEVNNICMATSGNYRNFYYAGDKKRSHTIDPRSGYPVQHSVLSATVVSTSCMRADALATACMVLGKEQALQMMERAQDAACYLIVAQNDTLETITSPNWAKMTEK